MAQKNIDPELRLISDYMKLNGNDKFVIPAYQRAYSWSAEMHCDKLWQDIESFIASKGEDPYFFGTVIIDCSNNNQLNLIDGQQRTTTFYLLMKALQLRISETIERIPKDDEDAEPLLEGLKDSLNILYEILYKADAQKRVDIRKDWNKAKDVIVMETLSNRETKECREELKRMLDAQTYDDAVNAVFKYKNRRNDNKYTRFFKNFKYFHDKLEELPETQLNVFARIFLTKCQVIEIRSWDIEQAITMFNSLNSTGMPLSDADIICAQLYSHAEDKEEFDKIWLEINSLANKLSINPKKDNIDGVLQQFMYINRALNGEYKPNDVTIPGVRSYYTYSKSQLLKDPMQLCESFKKILDIWDKIIDYPIVKILSRFNDNSKLFLISYLNRFDLDKIEESVVIPMAECLLRLFAVYELVDAGYSSKQFKTFLLNTNLDVVRQDVEIKIISEVYSRNIQENWKPEYIAEKLLDYRETNLVYLNEYLYSKEHNLPFSWKDPQVEHIMPTSGQNIDTIRIDAGISTKEEFVDIVNKLGNKILLEEDINKHISNGWFKTKKGNSVTDKKGYLNSKYALALALSKYPNDLWKKEDIEQATKRATYRILSFIFGTLDTPFEDFFKGIEADALAETNNNLQANNQQDTKGTLEKEIPVFICSESMSTDAKGVFNTKTGKLVVKEGSFIRKNVLSSLRKGDKELRDKNSENLLVQGFSCKLLKDIEFETPSSASNFCTGSMTNGLDYWQVETENGSISLKDFIKQL